MIEVDMKWDFLPGVDQQAYQAWAKKAIGSGLQYAWHRRIPRQPEHAGPTEVPATSVWKTMADWGNFDESAHAGAQGGILDQYAQNLSVDIWGPSPRRARAAPARLGGTRAMQGNVKR